MRILKVVFITLFVFIATDTVAQKTIKRTAYKPPALITLLSTYKDTAYVTSAEAEYIIGMPLRIVDVKKNVYTISSYQFLYRKNVVTEDEQGKASPATSIISDRFKATPLPEQWIAKVREQIKPGEMMYFFDIIAKDAQGRVMYAPDIKILVR